MYRYLATSRPFLISIFVGMTIIFLFSCELPYREREISGNDVTGSASLK